MRKGNKMKKLPSFENQSGQMKEIFLFSVKRNFINMCKRCLFIIEDLRVEHDVFLKNIKEDVDPELLKKLDYMDEDKYNYVRKLILDAGNDAFRDVEHYAEMIDIDFKKEKNGKKENDG